MNQTTEDSKKWNIIVGGNSSPNETGKIIMPPKGKGSIDTTRIVDDILKGLDTQGIEVNDNNREHETIMKNLSGYDEARKNRMTETAKNRRNREQKQR